MAALRAGELTGFGTTPLSPAAPGRRPQALSPDSGDEFVRGVGEFLWAAPCALAYLTGCPWAPSPFGENENADNTFSAGLMFVDPALGVRGVGRSIGRGVKASGVMDDAARGLSNYLKGQRGEIHNPGIGPKYRFKVDGRNRIADGLRGDVLTEVKNTSYQAYTQQIRDEVAFAKEKGLKFQLRLAPGTRTSRQLRAADLDPDNPLTIMNWVIQP